MNLNERDDQFYYVSFNFLCCMIILKMTSWSKRPKLYYSWTCYLMEVSSILLVFYITIMFQFE
jgi:hypothetical protein